MPTSAVFAACRWGRRNFDRIGRQFAVVATAPLEGPPIGSKAGARWYKLTGNRSRPCPRAETAREFAAKARQAGLDISMAGSLYAFLIEKS